MIFMHNLRPENFPHPQQKNTLDARREIILQRILNILLLLYTIGYPAVLIAVPNVIRSGKPALYIIPWLGLALITVIRRIDYRVRAFVLIFAFQALGAFALLAYGLSGTGVIFLLGATVLANILLPPRVGIASWVLSLFVLGGVGWLMVTGRVPMPQLTPIESSGNGGQWFTEAAVFVFVVFVVSAALYTIIIGMNDALSAQEKLTRQLEEEQVSLERRVQERSADLKKRVEQFEIASQIAREISGKTELQELLNAATNLVRDRFGFYHAGIFVNDSQNEFSILRAATGEAGRQMLERGHRLKIGEIGLVGYVAGRGEARISMDVTGDMAHYKNPLLPDTRSEMALPLRLGDRIIGALDVQSVEPNAFTTEDVRILQTIADQLAIAFDKTSLLEELQRSLDELDKIDRSTTLKSWRTHLRNSHQKYAYHYHDSVLDNQVEDTDHAQEALAQGQSILKTVPAENSHGRPVTVLAVPIKLRNQVLGVVDIHFDSANVSADLVSLIEGTVSRLAVSLENARLLEEIQYRAERERVVGEISSKVRAAADVDSVLRIAIQEIGRSLGVSEVMVQLRKES